MVKYVAQSLLVTDSKPALVDKPSHEWYRQWLSSTNDAYDIFLARCSEVGPKLCALAKAQGEDPSNIKSRIENLFDSLYYEPLPVANSLNPGVLTSGRARGMLMVFFRSLILV